MVGLQFEIKESKVFSTETLSVDNKIGSIKKRLGAYCRSERAEDLGLWRRENFTSMYWN